MQVTLRRFTPDPEQAIIEDAAVCWKSTPREQILHHIIKAGHWTPLESVQFNFLIEDVSRSLSHQLVRKRVGVAFCQESQRYVIYAGGFKFVVPPSILENPEALDIFESVMEFIDIAYKKLIALGIPGEDSRFVLPNACQTRIAMPINYHALIDLSKERLCTRAQWEVRRMVEGLKKEVNKVSPTLAQYLQPKCFWLKHCPESKPCGRWKEFK
jgi:thymidylate synthase (FAD)